MKTVLVVEARARIRELIKEYLSEDEVSVLEASDSREALSLLDQGNVDLVLIDTPMPGGDSTGLFSVRPWEKMGNQDVSSFLEKPFSRTELRLFVSEKIG